jgi:hypothetical protein
MRRFDRSDSLPPHERETYRDALFVKVIKSRHGTPGDEHAFRFDYTLDLQAAPGLEPPASSRQVVNAHFGGGRR